MNHNPPGSDSRRDHRNHSNQFKPVSQNQGQNSGDSPVRPASKNPSQVDSGDILTRKLPASREGDQNIPVNVGQPTMISPNGPSQMPFPQVPQGNPQMIHPSMGGSGGQGFPQVPQGHPQMPHPNMGGPGGQGFPQGPQGQSGYPMNMRQPQLPPGQPGFQGMGHSQLPPGSQMRGPPQGVQMTPQNRTQQSYNPNRFDNDNRGLQKMQDGNHSDGTYANTQICWNQCTSWMATWIPCCCCGTNPYKIVPEGFSGIIMRFGKFHKLVGPGMHYVLDEIDALQLIDKREKVVELKQQSVVSRDNTSFRVDAVLYYRAVDTYKSRFSVSNVGWALQDLASTTLRNAVGKMTMQEFLEAKEHLAERIENEIVHIAEKWGAKVSRVLVQDVYLPQEFRNSFSSSAVAKRISEAQIINSKAEVEVARLMRDAADALSTDAAFQIRYIDAIEVLSKSSNPKMIFFPADYTDVGTANNDLLSTMTDEMETLLRKR